MGPLTLGPAPEGPRGTSQHCARPGSPPRWARDQRTRAWEQELPCGPHAEGGTRGSPRPSLLLSQEGVRVTGDTSEHRPVFPGKTSAGGRGDVGGGSGGGAGGWESSSHNEVKPEKEERSSRRPGSSGHLSHQPTRSPTARGQGHHRVPLTSTQLDVRSGHPGHRSQGSASLPFTRGSPWGTSPPPWATSGLAGTCQGTPES